MHLQQSLSFKAILNFLRALTRHKRLLLLMSVVVLVSCSKSNDAVTPDNVDNEQPSDSLFYKLVRVENLYAPISDSSSAYVPPALYYSLENNRRVPAEYAKTNRWDVAFGGLYNSFLSGNNGSDKNNYGYSSIGTGGICIVKQHFDEVVAIPADNQFKTNKNLVGTDEEGAFGQGTGWYLYDFDGKIKGDGSYDKQHIAYALQDARTVILRTAKGNYAKIRMISCYKDAFTPDTWTRNTPHMYFTFEYVIVPKGSTSFEINK